jgi:tetratricopeptide (TPR) repeat protein
LLDPVADYSFDHLVGPPTPDGAPETRHLRCVIDYLRLTASVAPGHEILRGAYALAAAALEPGDSQQADDSEEDGESSADRGDLNQLVQVLRRSPQSIESIPGVFEEWLWRSGEHTRFLKSLHTALYRQVIRSKVYVLHESSDRVAYERLLHQLSDHASRINCGSVRMAILRLDSLTDEEVDRLADVFTAEELYQFRVQLIEITECASNAYATSLLIDALEIEVPRRLAELSADSGPLAARQWLRECRNMRYYPPKYLFNIWDRALRDGSPIVLDRSGGAFATNDSGRYDNYVVTWKPIASGLDGDNAPSAERRRQSTGQPEASHWELLGANFALFHELNHLAWSGWQGMDSSIVELFDPAFRTNTKAGSIGVGVLDGSGVHEPGSRAHVEDVEIRARLAAVVRKAHRLRLEGRSLEAHSELLAARSTIVDGEPESQRLALDLDASIATALMDVGEVEVAVDTLRACVVRSTQLCGPGAMRTSQLRDNLGMALLHSGRVEEALEMRQQVAADLEGWYGSDHPDTLIARYNVAYSLLVTGDLSAAVAQCRLVLASRVSLGPRERVLAEDLLASALLNLGRTTDALKVRSSVLIYSASTYGWSHPTTRTVRLNFRVAEAAAKGSARPLVLPIVAFRCALTLIRAALAAVRWRLQRQ